MFKIFLYSYYLNLMIEFKNKIYFCEFFSKDLKILYFKISKSLVYIIYHIIICVIHAHFLFIGLIYIHILNCAQKKKFIRCKSYDFKCKSSSNFDRDSNTEFKTKKTKIFCFYFLNSWA